MSTAGFKTLRHIETVRNYLNLMIKKLMDRAELHDQSKLKPPEVEYFETYTDRLRGLEYGSKEYRDCLALMRSAINHHQSVNRHHPEHFRNGINGMTLIDLVEMLCDWKAAGMRHDTGDLFKSIEINRKRFGISDQLTQILINTAGIINYEAVYNHADES